MSGGPGFEAASGRRFAAFPAAVVVFVFDAQGRLLLLSAPARPGRWEVVNGAMEAGESPLEAALREVREEAGEALAVRPLGLVHAQSFDYDERVRRMLSLVLVMEATGGEVVPGDDMAGSQVRWVSPAELDELGRSPGALLPPLDEAWLRGRARELFGLWRGGEAPPG